MAKALSTLGGAAGAGVLVWAASQVDRGSTGGYWAATAVLAAAGLVLGLARLVGSGDGGPRPTPAALVLSFAPALVAAGWVLVAAQPNAGWLARHVASWSRDAHLGSVVRDLVLYASVLAFGLGLLLGFGFERRPAATTATDGERPAAANGSEPLEQRASIDQPQPEPAVGGRAETEE